MTDRYVDIRAAVESGPTPGPWFAHSSLGFAVATVGIHRIAADAAPAADPASDIRYIAACHPEAIRALLAERDALREALWVATEHNALHFGESHSTVIQGRAALAQEQGD